MSYILDALKRADAERERGSVPGLHTQPAVPADDDDTPGALKPWMWMALGVSLALGGTLGWRLLAGGSAQEAPPAAPAVAQLPPAPAMPAPAPPPVLPPATGPAVAPQPVPMAAPVAAAPPTAPTQKPEHRMPAPPAAAPAAATAPTAAAAPAPQPLPVPTPPHAAAVQQPPAATPQPAPAGTPENRIYTRSQLPEDIRRELPNLAVGGSIYSENPASRFLIINGQVLHEGDKVNPDLSLEQIKLKAAVLKYKGYRYEITY
jgi:general secretion pathway protein B